MDEYDNDDASDEYDASLSHCIYLPSLSSRRGPIENIMIHSIVTMSTTFEGHMSFGNLKLIKIPV